MVAPTGELLFATFIGGLESEFGKTTVMIEDQSIIGGTNSGEGPVQAGQSRRALFGGSGQERLTGLALHDEKLCAAGSTKFSDWTSLKFPSDAFVVALNARTLGIDKVEYFGGAGDDSAWSIAGGPVSMQPGLTIWQR